MNAQFLDCNFNPSKNVTVLYIGQVKNEIHWCNSKIHQSRAIGHYLLFATVLCCLVVPQHVHGQLTYTSELSPLTHKKILVPVLKKITKPNFHHGALIVTIFMIVIFAGTKPALTLEKGGTTFSSFNQNIHPCHLQLQTIDPCHQAAILFQKIKKALYLHSQPHSHCQLG